MKRITIFAPVLLLTLTAATCGDDRPTLILPPAELASCAPEPEAPNLPAKDGTDATRDKRDLLMRDGYLNLRAAYGDCKAKVKGLATWREENGD